MFFTGTLQEGIVKAVQEQKRVVCFVRSQDEVSTQWEADYLRPLNEIMKDHAVLLDIQHGSTEAGYLSAICTVESAPMVVVIYNGQVKGTMKPPMAVDEFRKQVLTAMDLNFRMSNPTAAGASPDARAQQSTDTNSSRPMPSTDSTPVSPALSDAMADRRRRMEERELQETQQKQKATEARRAAAEVPNSQEAYQAKLAAEKKKQRQVAQDEKQRVLALIEADKKARRDEAAQRAADRNALRQQAEQDQEQVEEEPPAEKPRSRSAAGAGGKCRLQLRLWDGRTERAEFMALQTLAHVREWLDKNIEPRNGPYTLREVIGVGAARPLDVADEQETLSSLGLTPSATLIVKPVPSVSSKLREAGSSNALLQTLLIPWNVIKAIIVAVLATLSGFLRADHRNTPGAETVAADGPAAGRSTAIQDWQSRIQTLEDRNKKDKPTLYNGNQLGVLPKRDEDDEAEK